MVWAGSGVQIRSSRGAAGNNGLLVVSLARNLGLTISAEDIETLEQARILHGLVCDTLRGYYIGRPVRAGEIAALLGRRWTLDDAPAPAWNP